MEQPEYQVAWGHDFVATDCPHCDWIYLTSAQRAEQLCPHCGQATLMALESDDELPYTQPPELLVRPTLPKERVQAILRKFADGIPYPPADLSSARLLTRVRRLYLPLWLVDVDVSAHWQAEVGYNYEVVSHRERLHGQTWRSEEVKETRIRWEPRLGELDRHYANARAAALDEYELLGLRLGDFAPEQAIPYRPADVADAFVRLPNRPPRDAWSDAQPTVQQSAAAECQRAAGGQHIRQFRWAPRYDETNWTLLLLPLYTTYYEDDEGAVQMVIIQGQNGRLFGSRKASQKRAQRQSMIIALVALVLGLLSLVAAGVGLVMPPLVVIGGVGLMLALALMLGAAIPIGRVWQFNQRHSRQKPLRLDAQ